MAAIKCQHLTVSIQFFQTTVSVCNQESNCCKLKRLLVNGGILKAGYWRDQGVEEQGSGVSQVCSKLEQCSENPSQLKESISEIAIK